MPSLRRPRSVRCQGLWIRLRYAARAAGGSQNDERSRLGIHAGGHRRMKRGSGSRPRFTLWLCVALEGARPDGAHHRDLSGSEPACRRPSMASASSSCSRCGDSWRASWWGQCRGRDPRDRLHARRPRHRGRHRGRHPLRGPRLPVVVGRRRVRDRGNGYALGYAILPALGIDIGLVNLLVGLAVAVAFAIVAVVLASLPRMIIVAITALWGRRGRRRRAPAVGQVELDDLGYGGVDAALSESLLWTVVWLALAIVGIVVQIVTTEEVCCRPGRAPRPSRRARPIPGCPNLLDRGERARSRGPRRGRTQDGSAEDRGAMSGALVVVRRGPGSIGTMVRTAVPRARPRQSSAVPRRTGASDVAARWRPACSRAAHRACGGRDPHQARIPRRHVPAPARRPRRTGRDRLGQATPASPRPGARPLD